MKFTHCRSLLRHLKDSAPKHLAPIYLILTSDGFGVQQVYEEVFELFGEELAQLRQGESLEQELLSPPLLGRRSALFCKELDLIKFDPKSLERALSLAAGMPLFFCMKKLLATTKVYKAIEERGVILDLNGSSKPWEKVSELKTWLFEQCKEQQITITPGTAALLVERVSQDKRTLCMELEKLALFAYPEKQIDEKAVSLLCQLESSETVWQLGDALLHRQGKQALTALHSLGRSSESPLGWLRALRKQFQTHLEIASLLAEGKSGEEIGVKLPALRGARLQKSITAAKGRGKRGLARVVAEIDRTEFSLKNSSLSPKLLTEQLLYRIL